MVNLPVQGFFSRIKLYIPCHGILSYLFVLLVNGLFRCGGGGKWSTGVNCGILTIGGNRMGETFTEITIKNAIDVGNVKRKLMKKSEVRQITVRVMADTGSTDLIINEKMRKQLGLRIEASDYITVADNRKAPCHYTEPVWVFWKDRRTVCPAVVMPGGGEPLLGLIPMEGMDLMVDPIDEKVVGKHGRRALFKAVSVRRR
jgi:hypothetical protein